ncbi:MAG: hypothetical protein IJL88_06555 [Clostridia bacterium]|nr:hypothetical protein [Clostridia bacterium]
MANRIVAVLLLFVAFWSTAKVNATLPKLMQQNSKKADQQVEETKSAVNLIPTASTHSKGRSHCDTTLPAK